MDLKARLEGELAEVPKTAEDAARLAAVVRLFGAYLEVEREAESVLAGTTPVDPANGGSRDLSDLSLHEAAEVVLEQAGIPLHVRELGKRIKAGGWRHRRSTNAKPDQINYQLAARLPRYPDRFTRVAPNTFGIAHWASRAIRPPKPHIGIFSGPGDNVAQRIGDEPDEVAAGSTWR